MPDGGVQGPPMREASREGARWLVTDPSPTPAAPRLSAPLSKATSGQAAPPAGFCGLSQGLTYFHQLPEERWARRQRHLLARPTLQPRLVPSRV